MITKEELLKTEEYWFETIQNQIYRMVSEYLQNEGLTQSDFAKKLKVSNGYVSQIMNGNFNYTMKKLIELSLAVGQAPVINFEPIEKLANQTMYENKIIRQIQPSMVAEEEADYGKSQSE